MRESTAKRKLQQQVYRNWLRALRIVETLDDIAVAEGSPVEIVKGYTASDRETGELFLLLTFKSLSKRPIAALDIRVQFSDGVHPVPFRKDDFRYGCETATVGGKSRRGRERKRTQAIVCGEEFGQGVLLPLPEDYFHRMQIELVRVTYEDGGCESLGLTVRQKETRRWAPEEGERILPTRPVFPEEEEQERLLRDLPQAQVKRTLKEERMEMIRELHDTSAYVRLHRFESEEEQQDRVERYNHALHNLAMQEKEKKHRFRMLPIKFGLAALLALALIHFEEIVEFVFSLVYRFFMKG